MSFISNFSFVNDNEDNITLIHSKYDNTDMEIHYMLKDITNNIINMKKHNENFYNLNYKKLIHLINVTSNILELYYNEHIKNEERERIIFDNEIKNYENYVNNLIQEYIDIGGRFIIMKSSKRL